MTTTTPEPPALDSDVEDDLDEAFTADSWIAEEDPPEALSNLLPPRPDTHLEELEEEVRSRRVLILRQGAVIAVSTLVAIGGALLIHFFLGGVFILGLLFGSTPARETGMGSGGDAPSEGGSGYMVVDNLPAGSSSAGGGATSPNPADLLAPQPLPAMPIPTITPPASAERTVASIAPPLLIPEAQPLPVPDDLGTVKVTPPPRPQQPVTPPDLSIAPPTANGVPPQVAPTSPNATPAQDTRIATAAGARGPLGQGAGMGEDEEGDAPLPSMFKGGSGQGSGSGRGRGIGSGIDRGPSGADRPEPTVLDNPMPPAAEQPGWMRYNPPKNPVVFRLRITETGALGSIEVVASSGRPEVDAYYRDVISRWKFAPAISGGRPVARTTDMTFDPRGI